MWSFFFFPLGHNLFPSPESQDRLSRKQMKQKVTTKRTDIHISKGSEGFVWEGRYPASPTISQFRGWELLGRWSLGKG